MRLKPKVLLSLAVAIVLPGGFLLVPLFHLVLASLKKPKCPQ